MDICLSARLGGLGPFVTVDRLELREWAEEIPKDDWEPKLRAGE